MVVNPPRLGVGGVRLLLLGHDATQGSEEEDVRDADSAAAAVVVVVVVVVVVGVGRHRGDDDDDDDDDDDGRGRRDVARGGDDVRCLDGDGDGGDDGDARCVRVLWIHGAQRGE